MRLESPKLSFPENDVLVTLDDETVQQRVTVKARANGTFPLTVSILTPEGDLAVAPPTELTVQATTLSGFGVVLTVGALLVLATWWVRHIRRSRRTKAVARGAQHHPSAGQARRDLPRAGRAVPVASLAVGETRVPTPPPASPDVRTLAGRYRLDRCLAVGGMAEVWVATDTVLDRQVAVKMLKPSLASDPRLVERFRREAVAVARLSHPVDRRRVRHGGRRRRRSRRHGAGARRRPCASGSTRSGASRSG